MALSASLFSDDRIAQVERDLKAGKALEKRLRTALADMRQEVNEAYLKIARQQRKLKALTKILREKRRLGTTPVRAESGNDSCLARLLELAGHKTVRTWNGKKMAEPETPAPLRLDFAQESEAGSRIDGLWDNLPKWARGSISREDARFLDGIIQEVRPDQVYEVGVASGASSAVILSSMAIYGGLSQVWLHSYDVADFCYFDRARALGDAACAMVPDLLNHWKLNANTTALDIPHVHAPGTKSLYFLDANHSHPWPALDLIALLPGLQTGDHVVLHDIGPVRQASGHFADHGTQWFFEDWQGERLAPDVRLPNIGAIIIPEDKRLILASLVKTLSRPWALEFMATDHIRACEQRLEAYVTANRLG